MNIVTTTLVVIVISLASCRSAGSRDRVCSSNSLPLVGGDLGDFFPARKVQVYNLSEESTGRWFCLEATEVEFNKLLLDKKVSTTQVGNLTNNFDGAITQLIQFKVPQALEFGWSDCTVKTSLRLGEIGAYVFFDKNTGRLVMCIFR